MFKETAENVLHIKDSGVKTVCSLLAEVEDSEFLPRSVLQPTLTSDLPLEGGLTERRISVAGSIK